jgi:hypothetical protein
LNLSTRQNDSALFRRLLSVAYNGGVPIHLLDDLKLTNLAGQPFSSNSFDNVILNLNDICVSRRTLGLEDLIFNFKNHLLSTASEAEFRSLFWDGLIGKLFFEEPNQKVKYRLSSEWNTNKMFQSNFFNTRIADYVSLIKLSSNEVPILIVEMGNEKFPHFHKDFSKLLCLLTVSCINMAHLMLAEGKNPEFARVFGIWVGGPQFQFCVAHPIISVSEDNFYEIYANVSFFPHWKFDLLSPSNPSDGCMGACCNPNFFQNTTAFERILQGNLPDLEVLNVNNSKIPREYESIDVNEIIDSSTSTTPLPSTPRKQISSELAPEQSLVLPLFCNTFNETALFKLKCFIEAIKERIKLIFENSSSSVQKYNDRPFKPPRQSGFFTSSRKSTEKQSPFKLRTTVTSAFPSGTSSSSSSSSSSAVVNVKKSSESEHKIRCTLLPLLCFPRLFRVTKHEYEIEYEMERMHSMICSETGRLTEILQGETFEAVLFNRIRFVTHSLYDLHLLHNVFDLVHSDISPGNVMYSTLDSCWKINDFDQTMEIEESKTTSRTAGTCGFIAPESLKTGIFTPFSDVFALGQILFGCLYPELLASFLENGEYNDHLISKFESIMFRMIEPDPQLRITAFDALKHFYNLFRDLEKLGKFDDFLISTTIKFLFEEDCKAKSRPIDLNFSKKIVFASQAGERDPLVNIVSNAPE